MEIIQKLVKRKGPGHLFQSAHFYLAMKVIEEKGPIGRFELGRILDLGGGSIRTLVDRMKYANLIAVEGKKGHILTEEGKSVIKEIKKTVITIRDLEPARELTDQKFNIGCQARNISTKIGSGISMRDAAISVGGKSITSLIYTGANFNIPTLDKKYLEMEHPKLMNYLLSNYNFQKNDALVICGADTAIRAKLGAITAVFSLLNS